jgi:hypothetical protein
MLELPEELQERIAAYIDGQLSPDEAARLEVQLASTDPPLAERVVQMHADRGQIRALPRPHAPAELADRITEQIERHSLLREPESGVRLPWWQSRSAVAAGLAIVLGAFSYFVASSVMRPPANPSWAAGGKSATRQLADAGKQREQLKPERSLDKDATPVAGTATTTTPPEIALGSSGVPPATIALPTAAAAAAAPKSDTAVDALGTEIASAGSRKVPNMPAGAEMLAAPEPRAGGASEPGGPGAGGNASGGRGGMSGGFGGGGMGGGGFGGFNGGAGGGMGGGGGRGGRGGAVGGRGGAGRGAGAAGSIASPAAAPAAPLVESGMQNIVPTTTNAALAMAELSRDGGGPMVITFYARDDADYRNLALALATYAGDNARLSRRAATEGKASDTLETGTNVPVPSVRQQQTAAAPLNFAGSATMSGGAITGSVNNAGVITFPASGASPLATQTVNGTATSNLPTSPNDQSARANAPSAASTYDRNSMAPSALQQTAARGGPYHVALRPEQLAALAQSYRLAIVARAGNVMQFRDAGAASPLTANADERATLLQKAGLGGTSTSTATQTTNQAEAVPAQPAAPTVIDCVITMEPAPRTGP